METKISFSKLIDLYKIGNPSRITYDSINDRPVALTSRRFITTCDRLTLCSGANIIRLETENSDLIFGDVKNISVVNKSGLDEIRFNCAYDGNTEYTLLFEY